MPSADGDEGLMPFTSHLEELRRRLIRALSAVGIGFLLCLPFQKQIFNLLVGPLIEVCLANGVTLITVGPMDMFVCYLKSALLGGFLLSLPMVFFQAWAFIAPGLYRREQKVALPFVAASTFFFLLGAAFGYIGVMPFAFDFFISFAMNNPAVDPAYDVAKALSVSLRFLLIFGAVFEMPVAIFFCARIGLIDAAFLMRNFRYVAVGAFVLSALLTPPDPFTQVALAIPLIGLYLLSAAVAHLFGAGANKRQPRA